MVKSLLEINKIYFNVNIKSLVMTHVFVIISYQLINVFEYKMKYRQIHVCMIQANSFERNQASFFDIINHWL